jgi:hypothetical protein
MSSQPDPGAIFAARNGLRETCAETEA